MTTTTHERPIPSVSAAYLAAVGEALAGVPDSDRQELLDDLAEHLREMAPETEAGLIERLGTPEQYAAELLASAGIELTPGTRTSRLKFADQRRKVRTLADSPNGQRARAFWRELRPGWWVLRGWLVPAVLAARLDADSARSGVLNALWIPRITHKGIIDLTLLAAAIALSIRIGRAAAERETRGRQWASGIATALGVLALVGVASAHRANSYDVGQASYENPTPGALIGPNGNYISNVFAYDASGKWLGPVYLFDQDGAPLDVGNASELQNSGIPFVSGAFPQPVFASDQYGNTTAVQPKPPLVRVPSVPQLPGTTLPKNATPGVTTPTTARPVTRGDVRIPVTTVGSAQPAP